jgi:hypothetical protein
MKGRSEIHYAEIKEKILIVIDNGVHKYRDIYHELAVMLCSHSYDGPRTGYKNPKKLLENLLQDLKKEGTLKHDRSKGWNRAR